MSRRQRPRLAEPDARAADRAGRAVALEPEAQARGAVQARAAAGAAHQRQAAGREPPAPAGEPQAQARPRAAGPRQHDAARAEAPAAAVEREAHARAPAGAHEAGEAALGREDACRAHVERSRALVEQGGAEITRGYLDSVLGFLELGLGRAEAAVAALEDVAAFFGERPPGDPNTLQWAPDLIEGYVRAGRPADAAAALDGLARQAHGQWATAATARCRGLLSDQFAAHFDAALAAHDTPFEAARTELCYGERLRRAGQRTQARARLGAALAAFERLGAEPWAERARAELRASGARMRRKPEGATARLTPQELQVALAVARGATNREAAAELFLSPKTIEFHLRNVDRKLGLRSRTELVRRLMARD